MNENNEYENELETNPQEVSEQFDDSDIEETLDEDIETIDNIEDLESDSLDTQNQRPLRFGEKEYNEAKNEQGIYDKNYYANRKNELNNKVQEAEKEKHRGDKLNKKYKEGVDDPSKKYKNKNVFDKAKDNVDLLKAKNERFQNKLNGAKAKMYNVMHPGEALKAKAKAGAKNIVKNVGKKAGKAAVEVGKKAAKATLKGIKLLMSLISSNPWLLLITLGIIIMLFVLIAVSLDILVDGESKSEGLYGYEYVENQSGCTQITVSGDYAGIYNLEDYIAGVVEAEVGGFLGEKRREAAKAGAVAARSYLLTHVDSNCTIENSTRFQTYKTPSAAALAVAEETKGLVLVNSSGNVASTQYDAFCTASPQDDPDNYIVCQQSQKIPREWVDSQSGIDSKWKDGTKTEAHGNGMSQWGAAYLAEEKGYDFKEILAYYYTDLELMSIYKSFGGGNYPIEPDNEMYQDLAFLKDQSWSNFLESHGTTIALYDSNLYGEIKEAGIGTREGVVTAAVSLIGSLAEMGIKLNYQWGGKYYLFGTNSNWGTVSNTTWNCDNYASAGYDKSHCEKNYQWISFDCSGFVNWALRNGMQDTSIAIQETTTSGGIALSANKAVCEPGGTLVSEGHIVLVVGIDEENSRYIIAESTGSDVSKGTGGVKLSYKSFNAKGYVCKNLNDIYGD